MGGGDYNNPLMGHTTRFAFGGPSCCPPGDQASFEALVDSKSLSLMCKKFHLGDLVQGFLAWESNVATVFGDIQRSQGV